MAGPLLLITLGVLLLLNNIYPDTFSFSRMWPATLIALGLGKIAGYFYKGKKEGGA
jgi:hypothetical protein